MRYIFNSFCFIEDYSKLNLRMVLLELYDVLIVKYSSIQIS
jgi:hypothetical protein